MYHVNRHRQIYTSEIIGYHLGRASWKPVVIGLDNLLITDWISAEMPHGFSDIKLTACRIYSVARRSVHLNAKEQKLCVKLIYIIHDDIFADV